MIHFDYYDNVNIILILILVLIILLIARYLVLKRINKEDFEIAKSIIIGNEEIQEDYTRIEQKNNMFLAVLADGLGKNEAGRYSSITSVKTIVREFNDEFNDEKINYFFNKSFNKVNKEILKRVEKDKGGTSLLAAVITIDSLNYALVGDVMLCVFRNNSLSRISRGHSMGEVVKEEYKKGKLEREKALYALKEDKLLYYMGQESLKHIEMNDSSIKINKGDIIVLMSRGIYENIRWVKLEEILSRTRDTLSEKCDEIINIIERNGKRNNGSIILMKSLKNK